MAKVTRKQIREGEVRRLARELAWTGEYSGWLIIEQMLRFKHGYPEARSVLDVQWIRQELDEICERAKARIQSEQEKPDA
ncbi:hypothetical protein GCM10022268_25470 [Sphingomonas cynarae]|uniref:Uncharacterized protein n=1 Tax=Sphingomonas cynarae TaxID=930197 RepID=A0ABP7EB43_9SPHN